MRPCKRIPWSEGEWISEWFHYKHDSALHRMCHTGGPVGHQRSASRLTMLWPTSEWEIEQTVHTGWIEWTCRWHGIFIYLHTLPCTAINLHIIMYIVQWYSYHESFETENSTCDGWQDIIYCSKGQCGFNENFLCLKIFTLAYYGSQLASRQS